MKQPPSAPSAPFSTFDALLEQLRVFCEHYSSRIATALVILTVFWIATNVATKVVRRVLHRHESKNILLNLLLTAIRWGVLTFGVVTALGTVGVNVSGLVAGLGLTGFALGFALKDIVSNVLAGTMLLVFKPFRVDDYILVTGLEGTVTNIDLRYTTLVKDNRRILLPNASLLTNPIVVAEPVDSKNEGRGKN